MNTNYQMLKELNKVYTPKEWGVCTAEEVELIRNTLHIREMDILQLRNLRDFTVVYFGHQEPAVREDLDKMSAITYIIDLQIIELGGEV